MIDAISIVAEALKAVETGGVHSMHTPTEGGILNGLYEMGSAAGVGLSVSENLIPVAPETRIITEILGVDPLKLLSSGSLLMTIRESSVGKVLDALNGLGVQASIIGEVKERSEGRVLTRSDGTEKTIDPVRQDELFRVLGED
jgi:hydrogenase maturation factor